MWLVRRFAITGITRTIRTAARPTAITDQAGSRMGSLSAQALGTAGIVHITDATMVATLMTDMKDAGLRGADLKDVVLIATVLIDAVRRFEAASRGAAEAKASMEGSMEGPGAAANKTDRVI